jgi:hypothetical protein
VAGPEAFLAGGRPEEAGGPEDRHFWPEDRHFLGSSINSLAARGQCTLD